MKRIKLRTTFLLVAALFAAVVVHAKSDKQVTPRAISEIKVKPPTVPQTAPLSGSRQGYRMVTDVLNSFAGASESDNYEINVSSGGQAIAGGSLESDNWAVDGGYVSASEVKRGDPNGDGAIGAGDIVYLLSYLYRSGPKPCPMESGDANCDGVVGAGDIVYLLTYLYRGGPPPC